MNNEKKVIIETEEHGNMTIVFPDGTSLYHMMGVGRAELSLRNDGLVDARGALCIALASKDDRRRVFRSFFKEFYTFGGKLEGYLKSPRVNCTVEGYLEYQEKLLKWNKELSDEGGYIYNAGPLIVPFQGIAREMSSRTRCDIYVEACGKENRISFGDLSLEDWNKAAALVEGKRRVSLYLPLNLAAEIEKDLVSGEEIGEEGLERAVSYYERRRKKDEQ